MSTQVNSAPYTKAVVAAMRKLYPEALADHSFDNTGLLLEAPFNPARRQKNSVLLTIDLTKAVADEAIKRRDSCIVSYHPIIFRGLKSLTLENTQQQSLLRLAAEGISVYSPHTAIDAAAGGLGDWLADIVTGKPKRGQIPQPAQQSDDSAPPPQYSYSLAYQPSHAKGDYLELGASEHERDFIKKVNVSGVHGAGMGRIVRLKQPLPLTQIIERISLGTGALKSIPVAVPRGQHIGGIMIGSIAVCAGSGGHLFSELDDVDLLFTGELSHHETLAAVEKGQCVVSLFHSNSERGFLNGVLKAQLEKAIPEEFQVVREESAKQTRNNDALAEALNDDTSEVYVSRVDRDPYGIYTYQRYY